MLRKNKYPIVFERYSRNRWLFLSEFLHMFLKTMVSGLFVGTKLNDIGSARAIRKAALTC